MIELTEDSQTSAEVKSPPTSRPQTKPTWSPYRYKPSVRRPVPPPPVPKLAQREIPFILPADISTKDITTSKKQFDKRASVKTSKPTVSITGCDCSFSFLHLQSDIKRILF